MNLFNYHQKPESLHRHSDADKDVAVVFFDRYLHKPEELKKREDVIAKSSFACSYAIYVLKGRFPMGESTISKDPIQAYFYASSIIQGPWPLGESAILEDSAMAVKYATDVLKKPWPEAEKIITRDRVASNICTCFPEQKRSYLAAPEVVIFD